jgi:hypothetical protein
MGVTGGAAGSAIAAGGASDDSGAPSAAGGGSGELDAAAGDAGGFLTTVLTESLYDALFLHREDPACSGDVFTLAALARAAERFPGFASEGTPDVRKRELAAFLANVSHETTGGWPTAPDGPHAWGLCFREEVGCEAGACTQYCDASNDRYPCAAGKTYHGRGPIQLSWNYNYGQAGEALGLDLLNDPDRVADDGVVAWQTALWFWMTPQPPKPSAHAVMTGSYAPTAADLAAGRLTGFGLTVNIINGGLECGRPGDARVEDRVAFYRRYAGLLGVDPGGALYCDAMAPF